MAVKKTFYMGSLHQIIFTNEAVTEIVLRIVNHRREPDVYLSTVFLS